MAVPVRVLRPATGGALIAAGVCVNGHGPFAFLIDTGASITAIDSRVAALLRLRPLATGHSPGFGCDHTVSLARVNSLSVDGLRLEPQTVVVGPLRSPLTPSLDGLLGSDVLSRFAAIRIDFSSGRLTLAGPEGRPTNGSVIGDGRPRLSRALSYGTVTTVPAVMTGNSRPVSNKVADLVSNVQIQVAVGVGGGPLNNFVVDTGAGTTIISPALAMQAGLAESGRGSRGYAGLDCPVSVSHYRVGAWDLDAITASGHSARFGLAPQTVSSNILLPDVTGLLGSGTLLRYSPVVVDYRDADLLLGPLRH